MYFDAPADRVIQTAKVTISWNENATGGMKAHTGAVASSDLLPPTSMVCGNKGWGAHIHPAVVLTGFMPNPGDNSFVVTVVVRYSGETRDSLPLKRSIHFLG